MTEPQISVVIPCYNGAGFLAKTIQSALTQTRPPIEVIVVDDGSTDMTAAVAASCGPGVRVIRQSNGGAAVARNTGVAVAKGDWIAFLDADDLWEADRLEILAAKASTAEPHVVCVFNDLYYLNPDGTSTPRRTPIEALNGDFHVRLLTEWFVNPSCLLVRTAAARAVPFPAGVRHVEDTQFVVLLRRHGEFHHISRPLTGYQRRVGQLTSHPGHGVIAIEAHFRFITSRPDIYTSTEADRLRQYLTSALVEAHDVAYWRREHEVVRQCRRLYREVNPDSVNNPALFGIRLYPRWLLVIKDRVDQWLGRTTPTRCNG